jgi:glycerol-3-phosphate dehydrogenase
MGELIHKDLPYVKAEILWGLRQEMARTVEDILSRRTRSLLLDAKASIESAPSVAQIMAKELNFDQDWVKTQINEFNEIARHYLLSD